MTADFKLDDNGDLDLEFGRISIAKETDAVKQRVLNKLYLQTGGWDYDTFFGTPWIEQVFGAKSPLSIIGAENAIKLAIKEVEGVVEILSFKSRLDYSSRNFLIECSIKDTYGSIIMLVEKI